MTRYLLSLTTLLLTVSLPQGMAAEIDGFTEPSRDLDLAAADTGRIESIAVQEGQQVEAGQVLAALNQDVLKASRRIVEKQIAAQGRLKSAKAELRMRTDRVRKIAELLARRHAAQEELDRAEIEQEIAAASLEIVEEEQAVSVLERDRIDHQLERQLVRSPIDGVVVRTLKDVGEFVSPADPVVLRVVQLDPMLAVFNVIERATGDELRVGSPAKIRMASSGQVRQGVVEFVSPVIEPQSGTVRVKVRLDNANGAIRSGEKCALVIAVPVDEVASEPAKARNN